MESNADGVSGGFKNELLEDGNSISGWYVEKNKYFEYLNKISLQK